MRFIFFVTKVANEYLLYFKRFPNGVPLKSCDCRYLNCRFYLENSTRCEQLLVTRVLINNRHNSRNKHAFIKTKRVSC